MENIETYQVHARKGIFFIEIYEDQQTSDYLGRIVPLTPLDQAKPGHPRPPNYSCNHSFEPDVRDQDKETLIELCKKRITELGGEIMVSRKAIVRTERGLSIAGTRITIYQLMDYLKADRPISAIKDLFKLTDVGMTVVLEDILTYLNEYPDKHEEGYQEVLRQAEASRAYWEERNRERLSAIAEQPPKPGMEKIRALIEKKKAELGIR